MGARWKRNGYYTSSVSGVTRSIGAEPLHPYSGAVYSYENCYTESHPRLNGRWAGGGQFYLERTTYRYMPDSVPVFVSNPDGSFVFTNGSGRIDVAIGSSTPDLPAFPALSDSALDAMGTTAIARTEPTAPAFDLATAIGELRSDGIPNIPGPEMREQVKHARTAGDNYLNLEFGWFPLVRSVQEFATAVNNSDSILRKYQEGANRVIKRSYEWPVLDEQQFYETKFAAFPSDAGQFTGGGRMNQRTRKTWFEVDYIYYLPTGGSTTDKIRRYGSYARKLIGVDLSPEVLWNLAPWSWAADWFGNTGDMIHNISAIGNDGLVMRNGYIMSHNRYLTRDSGQIARSAGRPPTFQIKERLVETKVRRGATPLGFGVSYAGLSLKQKAIIAALGLSRW